MIAESGADDGLLWLDGKSTGSILIETRASWHLVDLDDRTITRIPVGTRGLTPPTFVRTNSRSGCICSERASAAA